MNSQELLTNAVKDKKTSKELLKIIRTIEIIVLLIAVNSGSQKAIPTCVLNRLSRGVILECGDGEKTEIPLFLAEEGTALLADPYRYLGGEKEYLDYLSRLQQLGLEVVREHGKLFNIDYNCYSFVIASIWPELGINNSTWVNPDRGQPIIEALSQPIHAHIPLSSIDIETVQLGDIIIFEEIGANFLVHAAIVTGFDNEGTAIVTSKIDGRDVVKGTSSQTMSFYFQESNWLEGYVASVFRPY